MEVRTYIQADLSLKSVEIYPVEGENYQYVAEVTLKYYKEYHDDVKKAYELRTDESWAELDTFLEALFDDCDLTEWEETEVNQKADSKHYPFDRLILTDEGDCWGLEVHPSEKFPQPFKLQFVYDTPIPLREELWNDADRFIWTDGPCSQPCSINWTVGEDEVRETISHIMTHNEKYHKSETPEEGQNE